MFITVTVHNSECEDVFSLNKTEHELTIYIQEQTCPTTIFILQNVKILLTYS